jgi:hypothetical protein
MEQAVKKRKFSAKEKKSLDLPDEDALEDLESDNEAPKRKQKTKGAGLTTEEKKAQRKDAREALKKFRAATATAAKQRPALGKLLEKLQHWEDKAAKAGQLEPLPEATRDSLKETKSKLQSVLKEFNELLVLASKGSDEGPVPTWSSQELQVEFRAAGDLVKELQAAVRNGSCQGEGQDEGQDGKPVTKRARGKQANK